VLGKVAEFNAILSRQGLRWTQLDSPAERHARLAEILDIRYGLLGEGIFDTLDRQGLLQHRLVEEAAIERAMKGAPAGTRAYVRSQAIKELAGRRGAACSWERVFDTERGVLDLSDPREQCAQWRPCDRSGDGESFEAAIDGFLRSQTLLEPAAVFERWRRRSRRLRSVL
jgi:hypothetical protein